MLLVTGVCPSFAGQGGSEHASERWTIGLSSSPLFTDESSSTEEPGPGGVKSVTSSSSYAVGLISWSMAALAGAVVLLAHSRALRREVMERDAR